MYLLEAYPFVVLGIVISVILPILRKSIPSPPKNGRYFGKKFEQRIWPIAKPYVMFGIFSLLVAVIIVASLGETLADWRVATIAGFSWDSLLQKVGKP